MFFTQLHRTNNEWKEAMVQAFMEFIKRYGVIGLAIAVIIDGKMNALIVSIVDGISDAAPYVFHARRERRTGTVQLGPIRLLLCTVFGAAIDFLSVAWLVFMVAKFILKEEKVKHRPPGGDTLMGKVDQAREV